MKKNRLFNALVLAMSLVLINTSCEIGLGSSVDVSAPTLSISYPEQQSVIRDSFIIAGECDDDKGISKINITVQRTDTGKPQDLKTLAADFNPLTGKWSAKINDWLGDGKGYNGWELPDGKYVASVYALDNSNRSSGIASLIFDIDNTAPIFIIKSPTSRKIESPTSYGTSFKVTGTMTDDHTVSKMTVKVYDDNVNFEDTENPPVPLETIYESSIDTTTEIVIANRNREGYLKDRYETFYAGADEGTTRALWCTVEMVDNAKVYQNPDETENETTGNITDRFYIVDDVNSTWSNSDKDMDPGKVKKIVNRTVSDSDKITMTLQEEVMSLYENAFVTKAAFSINSDSDPTYEIRNFGISSSQEVTKVAAAEAGLGFALSPGRNGDNVCPDSVKVFLWGPYDAPVSDADRAKMYSTDLATIEAFMEEQGEAKARVIAYNGPGTYKGVQFKKKDGTVDPEGYSEGSKPTYDCDVTLINTITTSKYYYISAYAQDLTGAIAKPSYDVFAFKGYSSGQAPSVKWEDTTFGTNTQEDDAIVGKDSVTYSGYAIYPDGLDSFTEITYKATVTDVYGSVVPQIVEQTITNISTDTEENKVYWKFTFDGLQDDEKLYQYRFIVSAKSLGESVGMAERRLTADTKKPEVKISDVSPIVKYNDEKCLNGSVKVVGSVKENNLSGVWYEIYSEGNKVYTSTRDGEDAFSIEKVIDTNASTFGLSDKDNKEMNIIFYAEDKAGNIGTAEISDLNDGNNFKLSQASDKPVVTTTSKYVEQANAAKTAIPQDKWNEKNAKLTFNITDDDGLTSVTIKKDNGSEETQRITSGSTNSTINYPLPSEDGVYQIKLTATDTTYASASSTSKQYRQTVWGPYTVGVDVSAPSVTDDKTSTTNYATDAFTLSGTASDGNGIADIEVKVVKSGASDPAQSYSYKAGTVTFTSGKWSVNVAKGKLVDGEYTVTTTATDFAGKSYTVESIWIVDTVQPVISSAVIKTAAKTVGSENNWYDTNLLDIEVVPSDATSGVYTVQYSLDGTNWSDLSQSKADTTKWTATVSCENQGANTIKIKAIDEAKLESEVTSKVVKIDTEKPNTLSLYSLDDDTEFAGTKMVSKQKPIVLVVNAADELSKIAKVEVVKVGTKTVAISGSETATNSGKWSITIPAASQESGTVTVKATDKVGHSKEEVLVTLDIDATKPTVKINSVTPVVTRESDGKSCLNGTITVSGKIENEPNLDKVYYQVNDGALQLVGSDASFTFTYNTTSLSNGTNCEIKVVAIDKAKNEGTASISSKNNNVVYVVDQTTDKPSVKPSNFTFFDATVSANKKETLPSTLWFDDSGNNKLILSVSDDDKLSSVKVVTKNSTGSSTVKASEEFITSETPTSTITYTLPSADGVYQVTLTAEDTTYSETGISAAIKANRTTTYGPFLVGVDTALPVVTETHSSGTNYVEGAIALSGTATDANGIKEITVDVIKNSSTVKTYTLTGGKVTLTSGNWTCNIPDADLADGIYTITVTATDYANRISTSDSNYVKDKVAPTVSGEKITTTGSTINGETWYKATTVAIEATASDATSGVANVQYKVGSDNDNWTDLKLEGGKWTANVKCDQGSNSIYIKAIDEAGLSSAEKVLTAKVDTAAPETLSLFSVAGTEGFAGNKMVNGKTALTFVVAAEDSGTGIASVKVTKIGTTDVNITGTETSTGSGKYTVTVLVASLKNGGLTVVATDKAGNATTESLFTITVDGTAPVVTVGSVTPVVSLDTGKFVNGTIKISGKANDTYLDNVWYEIKNAGTQVYKSADLGAVNGFEFDVDTTTYAKNSTLDVVIHATDKAGNEGTAKASSVNGTGEILFKVDQTTDKPVVTPSNFVELSASGHTKSDIPADKWFTTSNNKLIGSVSDDDVLKSVTIVTKNEAGTSVVTAEKELVVTGSTASTANITYSLPATDGVYQVTIVATDDTFASGSTDAIKFNRKTTFGPILVGVDSAAPEVTESHSTGTNYAKGAIALSGTASDSNGIKEIAVSVVNTKTSAVAGTYTLSGGTVTLTGSAWTCTVPASLADGSYRITTTATDYAGKTSDVVSNFVKDNTAPTVSAEIKTSATNGWYKTTTISIEATASDATSGVSSVEYSTDNSNWAPLKQSTTDTSKWTANVTCSTQGENKIYIKATDNADVEGRIQNDYKSVNIDSNEPEVCELVSIDGDTDYSSKKLVNGKSNVVFVVTAKDAATGACTGVASVAVTHIGNTSITGVSTTAEVTAGSNQYELTIPAAKLDNGSVKVTVTDKVGLSKEFSLFTLDKDIDAPVVEIADIKDAADATDVIDVNSNITFSGTTTEVKGLNSLNLFYAVASTKPAFPEAADQKTASKWTAKGWKTLTNAGSMYAWKATLDTTAETDNTNLFFVAVAEDTAGNLAVEEYTGTSGSAQLYINQDSDRPKLLLSNLALTKETAENSGVYTSAKDTDGKFWHQHETLQGTVEDDDGNVQGIYWSENGSSWSSNIYRKGTWSITGLEDGNKTIYFKVTDAAGNDFVSAATGTAGPKVIDSNEQECLGFTGTGKEVSEILNIKVDNNKPGIDVVNGYVSSSPDYVAANAKGIASLPTVGGENKYLFVSVSASDSNGLSSVTITLDGKQATTAGTDWKIISQTTDKTLTVARFDLSKLVITTGKKIENKDLKISVVDNAGKDKENVVTVTVDNVAPVITFTQKQNVQLYGSVGNNLSGHTDDSSLVSELFFKVTDSSTAPTSGWSKVACLDSDGNVVEDNQIAIDNWSIAFDAGDTTTTEYHTKSLNVLYKTVSGKTDAQIDALASDIPMYLWMYAVDTLGNTSAPVSLAMKVTPNADKPAVEISYPTGEKPIGGNIRVTGTATIAQDSVRAVYMQIDPDYTGASDGSGFASDWETKLQTLIDAKGVTNYSIVSTGKDSPYNRGILVTGTSGWAQLINADHEFDTTVTHNGNAVNRTLALRVFALSNMNEKLSDAVTKVVQIDPNSPLFGNEAVDGHTGMYLVQYASGSSGTISARKKYAPDMSIKGQWYLRGSISDDSGIAKATVNIGGSTTTLIDGGAIKKAEWVSELGASSDGKGKNYIINIPVGDTRADKFGRLTYEVYIQDGSASQSDNSTTYSVNYDNMSPVFAVTTQELTKIYQSNGTYTLAGTVTEESDAVAAASQSGFERVVMYITNERGTSPKTTLLVDPMVSKGSSSVANREAVADLDSTDFAKDGLYWRSATINGVSSGSMTVSKINNTTVTEVTPKVRAGGLCKVDGVIYRIKYAKGTSVVLDNNEVDTSAKTVYFAAGAMVIDNPTAEGGKTAVYDNSKTETNGKDHLTAGDGDQMIESAKTAGTETTWSASIDSTQIRDGEVTVHFVAFDKAGNISTDEFTATVMNNAPRFAGVKFASDLNKSGVIENDEWITEYADMYVQVEQTTSSTLEKVNGKDDRGQIINNIVIPEESRLPIKSQFAVIPQIVGGNDGLKWSMSYTDNNGAAQTTTAVDYGVGNSSEVIRNYGTDADADDYTTKNDNTFKIEYNALKLLQLNGNVGIDRRTGHEEQDLVFTIEDKTEGNALTAAITLPVNVAIGDTTAPEAFWKPFFWNSKSDNSLYNNSSSNGHIELGEEWTTSTSTETEFAKVSNDTDSKVSGIITMEGVARDNVGVTSITVNVDGTDYVFSRNGANWTTTAGHLITLVEDNPDTATNEAITYANYFTSGNDNNWYFELVSDEIDTEKTLADGSENPYYSWNIVNFKFHWNTDKLLANSNHTKPNVNVTVKASDEGPTVLNAAKTAITTGTANVSTTGSALTTKDAQTDRYQMDVVPYIAKVYTELAALQKKEAKWSVTSRTSNGAYPVRKTTKNVDGGAGSTETVSFYGFNLTGATYTDGRATGAQTTTLGNGTKLSSVTGYYDVKTLDISKIMASATNYSGELKLKVGNVYTLNNLNNNNAKGSYTGTLTDKNCGTYGYNRQPNGENNNKLTDDVSFDIWEINSQAAKPMGGRLEQPIMSINPVTGLIGFAFVDGPNSFSMGGANTNANSRPYSYYQWLRSYDGFTSVSFRYDSYGNSYGTGAGGDINGTPHTDKFVLASSRGGSPTLGNGNTYGGDNCSRLEQIGQKGNSAGQNTGTKYINKQRVKSPSLATVAHGNGRTNLYLAYYDAINDEVRVRYGSVTGVTNNRVVADDFAETATGSEPDTYNIGNRSIVANTAKNAGEYVAIAALSAEGTATNNFDDKLVAVWYNVSQKTLYYSYNANPTGNMNNTTKTRGSWSNPIRVFDEDSDMAAAGQYVKMVADKNGGIHIAGYDPENQDLCYAYLASPSANATTASFRTAVIDSKDVVGSNLTIDTVLETKNGSNVVVPYISYYSTENVKPMLTYLSDTSKLSSGNLNGAEDDMYTGVWECSLVPTTETPDMQSKLFNVINVGLWKNVTTGVIANSVASIKPAGQDTTYPTSTIISNSTSTNNGVVLGNGTSNAVLGYSVKHGGGSTNIETAQKR